MKRLPPPKLDPGKVYETCWSEIQDANLVAQFVDAIDNLLALAEEYQQRTAANELHYYPTCEWGKNEQVVLDSLTKAQLIDLYSKYMVPASRPARAFYDQLINTAPLGKCPLCGFGQVTTLDHFMSKAYYPYFSVLPINLVPVCGDCNKKKASSKLEAHTQASHPYFEEAEVETEKWLYACVAETLPATATFSVVCPPHWSENLCGRVRNHFQDLRLASRFAIEAASEMAALSDFLGVLGTSARIGEHLALVAQSERMHRTNSWRAALYEGLSQSAWYQEGGYRRPVY